MHIQSHISPPRAVARLTGELDHHSAEETRRALEELISPGEILELTLDMRHVTFMDSSGLGVILGRFRTLSAKRGRLYIMGPNTYVDRILRMAGVYTLCPRRDAREES